jgi:predicted metal-dependent RNase
MEYTVPVAREAHMRVSPDIREPLMNAGAYLGTANAYVIILTMLAFAIAEVFLLIMRWYP